MLTWTTVLDLDGALRRRGSRGSVVGAWNALNESVVAPQRAEGGFSVALPGGIGAVEVESGIGTSKRALGRVLALNSNRFGWAADRRSGIGDAEEIGEEAADPLAHFLLRVQVVVQRGCSRCGRQDRKRSGTNHGLKVLPTSLL
jgi:hypothetical protein